MDPSIPNTRPPVIPGMPTTATGILGQAAQYMQHLPQVPLGPQPKGIKLGPTSSPGTCPFCKVYIQTRVVTVSDNFFKVSLLIFFCWCLCCVPFMFENFKRRDHYCPNCGRYILTYCR